MKASAMERIHLVEFSDEPWFPHVIRTALMARLEFVARIGKHHEPVAAVLAKALGLSGARRIIDLGSGAGGPMVAAFHELQTEHADLELVLTDLYPNRRALARAVQSRPESMHAFEEPVDATRVPASLVGIRSMVNLFHHFRPEVARAVLQDAVAANQPLVIVELLRRHPLIVALTLFSWIGVFVSVPFLRPFRWSWLFWTYGIPLIPLSFTWDATVSALRTYSEAELRAMIGTLEGGDGYDWTFEELRLPPSPVPGLALIGVPGRNGGPGCVSRAAEDAEGSPSYAR